VRRLTHKELSVTCAEYSMVVSGSLPMMIPIHRVEGYHHAGLAYVQAVHPRQAAAVDRNFPIVTEMEECVVEYSWKSHAMLACGTKSLILDEEEVGVVVHVHLKI
jgi:hypothetical protein